MIISQRAVAEEFQHGQRSDHVQKRIGNPQIQELRPFRQKSVERQQHDRKIADGIDGQQPIERRRPGQRTRHRQRQREPADIFSQISEVHTVRHVAFKPPHVPFAQVIRPHDPPGAIPPVEHSQIIIIGEQS